MTFRSAGLLLVVALAVSGCTRTALYQPPGDDDARARLSIESALGSDEEHSGRRGPDAGESVVAIFKVAGERVAAKGGEARVFVAPGERAIEIFADHRSILRFGTLTHRFEAGRDYRVLVDEGEGDKRYRAILVPDQGGGVMNVYDETRF